MQTRDAGSATSQPNASSMNTATLNARQLDNASNDASSVRVADEVAGLAAIFEPQVNIAVLRRSRSAAFAFECERALAQTRYQRLFSVTTDAPLDQRSR